MNFDLDKNKRKEILLSLVDKIDEFYSNTKNRKVSPNLDIKEIQRSINQFDLNFGENYDRIINTITKGLEQYSVHTPHPKYFGLFNPRANFAGILADLITATYNPQLAAWSHAPYAVEIEAKMIKELSKKFGYKANNSDGVFTSGGAEANLTAVQCALNSKYPRFAKDGIYGIKERPIIYCSEEAHHSVQKAAKITGLGYDSVKTIPVNNELKIETKSLEKNLQDSELIPLMIIGTAGTTGTGAIDDLVSLSSIAKKYGIWFHVDAAYGGGAILSSKHKNNLIGIENSDSITFDAHKWMSVPMGTSVFLTSKPDILGRTFRITTEYMPKEAEKMNIVEPFTHSIQWSRRFTGLKVYLALLFYGWNGYEQVINHQVEMGNLLKQKLINGGWIIKNNTNLPVICFTDKKYEHELNFTKSILENVLNRGKTWLSVYPIKNISTFRACITNYNTTETELDELVNELNLERSLYEKRSGERE